MHALYIYKIIEIEKNHALLIASQGLGNILQKDVSLDQCIKKFWSLDRKLQIAVERSLPDDRINSLGYSIEDAFEHLRRFDPNGGGDENALIEFCVKAMRELSSEPDALEPYLEILEKIAAKGRRQTNQI